MLATLLFLEANRWLRRNLGSMLQQERGRGRERVSASWFLKIAGRRGAGLASARSLGHNAFKLPLHAATHPLRLVCLSCLGFLMPLRCALRVWLCAVWFCRKQPLIIVSLVYLVSLPGCQPPQNSR